MMIKHDIPAHELVRYACAHARHITQQARHYNTAQPHQILIVSASAQPPAHMRQMLTRISARTTGSRPPATPGVHHSHRATRESRRQLPSRRGRPPAAPTRPRAARPAGRRWPRPAACAPHTRGASALDTWRRAALPTPAAGTRSVVSHGSHKACEQGRDRALASEEGRGRPRRTEGSCPLRRAGLRYGGRRRGLPVEGLGLLLLRIRKLLAAKMASHSMYLSAAQEGTRLRLVSPRKSRWMACVRACEGFSCRSNFPRAHAGQAAWAMHAATSADQTDDRMRGARDGTDGGSAHPSNGGLGHRAERVLRGRREEGDGAPPRPREEPAWPLVRR